MSSKPYSRSGSVGGAAAVVTTHVLDTAQGRPAQGVRVELFALGAAGEEKIATAETNADGRTDEPLLTARGIRCGRYRLDFHIGAYFAAKGLARGMPPFLDVVPVAFGIADPEGHYHVPFVGSPWGYSSYRGGNSERLPNDDHPAQPSREPRHLAAFDCAGAASSAPGRAPSPGDAPGLTVHVLDVTRGRGAGGLRLELFARDGGQRKIKAAVTTADGRTGEGLVEAGRLAAGRYTLVFQVGDYFAAQGYRLPQPRFFDAVPVAFGADPREGHCHVPLLIAPWGYTAYRGS